MLRIWRLGRRRDIIHVAWGPLTEKLKLQKKKKKKNLWWRSEDKRTTSPSLSHLDFFSSPPHQQEPPTHLPISSNPPHSLTYSLLVVLLFFTILDRCFCRFCYWLPVLAGTQQSRTHVPTTLVRKNPSRWLSPLLLQLAHGTFDKKKKAFEMFCRQTSFETLKPKKKNPKNGH